MHARTQAQRSAWLRVSTRVRAMAVERRALVCVRVARAGGGGAPNLLTFVRTIKLVAVTSCCTRSPAYEIASPLTQLMRTSVTSVAVISERTVAQRAGSP